MLRLWVIVGSAMALSGTVRAEQNWDFIASKAQPLQNTSALAAVFWSDVASCKSQPSALARRQCRGILAQRKARKVEDNYLVAGDSLAVQVGKWNAKSKTVTLTVRACVSCKTAVKVEGARRFIIAGSGQPTTGKRTVLGPKLATLEKKFKSKKFADYWLRNTAPRLVAEFVVSKSAKPKWARYGKRGFRFDVVAHRVFDPCDGGIVNSSLPSKSAKADKSQCSDEPPPVEDKPKVIAKPKKPAKPALPKSLTTAQVHTALAGARDASSKCFQAFGVTGSAKFRITISGDGKVVKTELIGGDFEKDEPSARCLTRAIQKSTFPKTQKKKTTIRYPFVLQ